MERRKFINRTLWGLGGAALMGGLYTWQVEPFWVEYVHVKMPIPNLPDHLKGKALVQISDLHISRRFNHQYILKAFEKVKNLHPDFVVYTGDYVTKYSEEKQDQRLNSVLEQAPKGKLGTVAVLGNHDYGKNWAQPEVANSITALLQQNGITVLRNESIDLNGLNIIGMDDYWGVNFHPKKAMESFDVSKANLVLCHNPDACDLDFWGAYNSWILSGHTHGGQVKPPFLPTPMLPVKNKKYSAGEIALSGGRTLYINRALGNLWQVRFNVRPEITIFQLEKKEEKTV